MLHRDDYIRMLEKRASDFDGGKTGPTYDHDVNNDQDANAEHRKNLSDSRATLGGMFKNMGEAQKVETRFAHKWFPSEKYEKDTSSPLIKVAMETLSGSEQFRGYAPHYKAAAIRSFTEELEKIAFAVSEKGHKFDAEKHRLLARQSAEQAEHLEQPEYNALATNKHRPSLGGVFRFGYHGAQGRPDMAGKHEEGKNAWNPMGGALTPSSFETDATPGFWGKIGKTKVHKNA